MDIKEFMKNMIEEKKSVDERKKKIQDDFTSEINLVYVSIFQSKDLETQMMVTLPEEHSKMQKCLRRLQV